MLYILAGASGCGKKFVIDRMKRLCIALREIRKFTDKKKPDDPELQKRDLDYDHSYDEILRECGKDFMYQYGDNWYGIKVQDIDAELMYGCSPIVIVRDYKVISNLKKRYPFASVMYIYTALTGEELSKRLSKLGIKDDVSTNERMLREKNDYNNMINLRDEYDIKIDGFISNRFDYTIDKQLQNVLQTLQKVDYMRVFLAMPFGVEPGAEGEMNGYSPAFLQNVARQANRQINIEIRRKYPDREIDGHIQKVKEVYILRADDVEPGYYATYSIYERMSLQIKKSFIIICDLSLNNANVSYEYGEARLSKTKKNIITIAKDNSFAIRNNIKTDIVYSDSMCLINNLVEKILKYYHIVP